MLKAVLLILILLACTAVGRSLSNARRRRCEMLGEMLAAMRVLRLRMLNSLDPLSILLQKSDSELFCKLGAALQEGGSLPESWMQLRTADARGMLACLHEGDLHALDLFFQDLGKSGRDEQNQLFANTIAELEEYLKLARKRYQETAKLYTALGSMVGIAICILIV